MVSSVRRMIYEPLEYRIITIGVGVEAAVIDPMISWSI